MCGFIGIYGPDGVDVAGEVYEGLLAVQHRGQDAAGIITFTDAFHVKKGLGLVLEVFNETNMSRLRGNLEAEPSLKVGFQAVNPRLPGLLRHLQSWTWQASVAQMS